MTAYKCHLVSDATPKRYNEEHNLLSSFGVLDVPSTTETASIEDSGVIVVVVSSTIDRSQLNTTSPLVLRWNDLLSKNIDLLFVIDKPNSAALQPEVEVIWEELKTKARQVFPGYDNVAIEIGANFLKMPNACFQLYKAFLSGKRKDPKQAFHYMMMAADLGHAESQLNVANSFNSGTDVEVNLVQAAHYYKLAAANNKKVAHLILGKWYAAGMADLDQDNEKALHHFNLAESNAVANRYKDKPIPETLCLNTVFKHTTKHDVFISYAEEFDSYWASTIQDKLVDYNISAYVFEKCRLGMDVNVKKQNVDAVSLIKSSRKEVPVSCASKPRSAAFKAALSSATTAFIVVISPPCLKLMALRLAAGLSDHLMEDWREIIQLCKTDPSRKLILLKAESRLHTFNGTEGQGEVGALLEALESASRGPSISARVNIEDYSSRLAVGSDVVPEIVALHFGRTDVLTRIATRYVETFTKKSINKSCVSRTREEVIDLFTNLIIPRLESEMAIAANEAANRDGTKSSKKEVADLNTQFCTCIHQLATLLSGIPEQKEAYLKYLRIAADGIHREAANAQFTFAKEMEVLDPGLSFIYFQKSSANNHVFAAFRLGELWEAGSIVVGGETSLEEAAKYYAVAGNNGHQEAGTRLLDFMKKGKGGIKRDLMVIYNLEERFVFDEVKKRMKRIKAANPQRSDEDDDERSDEDDDDEGEDEDNDGKENGGEVDQKGDAQDKANDDQEYDVPDYIHEESVHQLAQALEQVNHPYCVSGILPVTVENPLKLVFQNDTALTNTLPQTSNREFRGLDFPLHDPNDLESLIAACSPASFGFNTETVMDNDYRKALKLDSSCLFTNFDVYASGIVGIIKKSLLQDDSNNVAAVLHKLNVYGPEGFFKAHVDTPISKDMFGSLVVCLPVAFEGGILSVSKGGNNNTGKAFDWGTSVQNESGIHLIQWAAFFSDCPHKISPVVSGTRVTLTYNLFKRNPTVAVFDSAENSLPRDCIFLNQLRLGLSNPSFCRRGGILAFHCHHAYQIPEKSKSGADAIIPMLKGADMKVFQAAISSGLQVFVKPLFSDHLSSRSRFFLGDSFGNVGDNSMYESGLEFLKSALPNAVEIDSSKVLWFGKPLQMDCHEYAHYGNEASVGYIYSSAAIIVVVPSWKNRHDAALTKNLPSPPKCDSYICYAEEFDSNWAGFLQHFLKKHSISAFVQQNDHHGSYRSNRDAKIFINSPDAQPVPNSCVSRERTIIEQSNLAQATNMIVVIISPPSLKLMALRLAAGLTDHLLEEWKEILNICTVDTSRKLVLLKVSDSFEFEADG
ncbi:hypothetical protein BDR26DRAFT_151354 [Obelidium mucronatum]|nr:hypothetical protein BDR26DRAFT_151354 [Obelidium mucronatum]